MVMLFLAFVLGPDLTITLFGLTLAAAVLLDAVVVREANRYLPRWLDRVLPRLSVEGPPGDRTAEPQRAGA